MKRREEFTGSTTVDCEIVVILDNSGSMQSIKSDMEGGFDHFIQEQQALPGACTVSLVRFCTGKIETVYEAVPLADVQPLAMSPEGGTPLLDAVGQTIERTALRLAKHPSRKVVMLIITDGEENASRLFTREQIKALIDRYSATPSAWVFSYLGANVDAFQTGASIGIGQACSMDWVANSTGSKHVYVAVSAAVGKMRSGAAYNLHDTTTTPSTAGTLGLKKK